MKKIFISIIFLELMTASLLDAQRKDGVPNISSPETTTLLKYEDFPNIEAIGGTNITIPIYTLQLDDMEIPISLNYTAKGIKVSEIASNTGLGWMLNAGGSITYEMRDFNDVTSIQNYFDPYGHDFEPERSEKWWRMRKGYHDTDIDHGSYPFGGFLDYEIDSSPDFYHINAPGLNDVFYLKKDLKNCPNNDCDINYFYIPRFTKNSNYKSTIPLQYKKIWFNYSPNGNPSRMTVASFEKFGFKNEKGYEYKFGQLQAIINDFWPAGSLFETIPLERDSPNTWHLESIKSPSSTKEAIFTYEQYNNPYDHKTLSRSTYLLLNFDSPFHTVKNVFSQTTEPFFSRPQSFAYNKILYSYFMEPKRLRNIKLDNVEVIFNYDMVRQDYAGNALTSIVIKDALSNKIIKTVDLRYSYFLPSTPNCNDQYDCLRLRLDEIKDSSSGKYIFNYGSNNSDNAFPKRSSSKVDFLGYFNNNNTDFQFPNYNQAFNINTYESDPVFYYPNLERDNFFPFPLKNRPINFHEGSINRTPNPSSLIGLLSSVHYPTGANLMLEYENDIFRYLGEEYMLGTARIKKMKYVDENNVLNQSNFYYNDIDGLSSGQVSYFKPPSNLTYVSSNIGLEFNTSTVVLYSKVKEEKVGRGSVIKEYSNFSEYPDKLNNIDFTPLNGNVIHPPTVTNEDKRFIKHFKFPNQNALNFSIRRGNLMNETIFDNSGKKLKEIKNTYDYYIKDSLQISQLFSKYDNDLGVPRQNLIYSLRANNNVPIYQNFLKQTTVSEFYSNGNRTKNINYRYDKDRNLLTGETTNDLDNYEKKYLYAHDKGNQFLIDNNIISVPLETEIKKNNILLSRSQVKFPLTLNEAIAKTSGFPIPYLLQSYNIQSNEYSTDILYDYYDNKGNITQYSTKDGATVGIVWGYNKTLPIAKIEGKDAVYFMAMLSDEIMAISIASNKDINSVTEAEFRAKLDVFQSRQNTLDVSVTTYTHDPLIGVKSITPPSGIRELYLYDSANRLEKVVDVDGKVLKEMKYNYKN